MNIVFVSGYHGSGTSTAKAVFEYLFCKAGLENSLHCVDAGCNCDKALFYQADIIIVQSDTRTFCRKQQLLDLPVRTVPVIYLWGKYFSETEKMRKDVLKEYRLEEIQLGVIPFNRRFEEAVKKGEIGSFLECAAKGDNFENTWFYREMEKNVFRIRKLLENRRDQGGLLYGRNF